MAQPSASLEKLLDEDPDFSAYAYFRAKYPNWLPGVLAANFVDMASSTTLRALDMTAGLAEFLTVLSKRLGVA